MWWLQGGHMALNGLQHDLFCVIRFYSLHSLPTITIRTIMHENAKENVPVFWFLFGPPLCHCQILYRIDFCEDLWRHSWSSELKSLFLSPHFLSWASIRLIFVPHLLPAASVGIVFTFLACVCVIMEFFLPWRRLLLWEVINKMFSNFCLVWLMSASLSICVSAKLHTHMWEQHWFTISHSLYSPLLIFLAFAHFKDTTYYITCELRCCLAEFVTFGQNQPHCFPLFFKPLCKGTLAKRL